MMDPDDHNEGATPYQLDDSERQNVLAVEEVEGLQEICDAETAPVTDQSQVEEVEICQLDLQEMEEEMEVGVSAQDVPDGSNQELYEVWEGVEQGRVDNTNNALGIDNGLEGLCALEGAMVAEESDERELGVIEGLRAFEGAFVDEESVEIELRVIDPDEEEASPVCRVDQRIHQLEILNEDTMDEQPQGRLNDEADTSPDRGDYLGLHVFDEIASVQNEGALRIQDLHAVLQHVDPVERNPSRGGRSTHAKRARYHQRLLNCDRRQRRIAFEIPFLEDLHERPRNLFAIAEDAQWPDTSTASIDMSSVADNDSSTFLRSHQKTPNAVGSNRSLATLRRSKSLEAINISSSLMSMNGVFLFINDSDGMPTDLQNMPNEDNKSIKSYDSLSTTSSWSDSVLKKKKKSCVSKMLCCLLPWLKCCRGNKQPK